MSSRPVRRGPTPASISLTPQPKPTISLEEWEAKAPLGDLQIRSINAIKASTEKVPLPLKFTAAEPSPPVTPVPRQQNKLLQQQQQGSQHSSRPGTPLSAVAGRSAHALHPKQPVQTPQQFYDWFALIDRSVAHSQEAHYRAHVASISNHLDTCDLLIDRIDEVDKEVDGMLEGWRGVEEGGKSLKDACERLLEERDSLLQTMEDIGGQLEYFQELEHATRMLNHPGESLIFQADFLYMVERVDICIDFLKAHRHFREAEIYLLRFQQCMTRAMTLIKMNFVGSLRALSSEIAKRLSDKDVSPTAQAHLLYTRFKSVSSKIAPLLGELERRAQSYPDELSALLAECHAAYFSTRRGLMMSRIMEEIKGLDPSRSELVELTRSGCSYLKQLCTDEFNLYREFFSTAEDQLYQYLETLCDLLYDDLRPRILHEPRLTVLCEVCTVLQALMVLDASSAPSIASSTSEDDDDEEDDTDSSSEETSKADDELTVNLDEKPSGKLGRRLHISHLLKMVLQDAQTRLFFKAQAVIQSEIRHFVPKAEDLAYPDMLLGANKPLSGPELREKESVSQIFRVPSLDKQDTWYPTMRRTVWVLAQLHDFVKPAIFEDIAQEALSFCRLSLLSASDLLKTRNPPSSVLDGSLFLARHLLILKEIMHSLELDMKQRDDGQHTQKESGSSKVVELAPGGGGGVSETLSNMFNKTTSMLPEGLFASLGVTRGPDGDMRGVKVDIDHGLRQACEDVIAACANPVCEPMESWTTLANAHKFQSKALKTAQFEKPPHTSSSHPSQPPPPPPAIAQNWAAEADNVNLRFREACERDLRAGVTRLRLYLEDERTVRVLLDHVQDRVVEAYARYRDVVVQMAGGGGEGVVLSVSALREILGDVCGDGKV
ncbi:Sec34-like family-domain-containing protein [Crassisporium funariophilum]|nr:Sec34-like family-domain-containing protein [Crassisporium funariophilum]